jgi:uncharacterized membrane protein
MAPDPAPRRLPRPIRIIRARPRLSVSVLIGLVVAVAMPEQWRLATRILLGWDVGVVLYLVGIFLIMINGDVATIRRRSAVLDEGQGTILALTSAAALASIGAIVVLLRAHEAGAPRAPLLLADAVITIVLSWTLIHTIFALHYAHEYYAERNAKAPPLVFPNDDKPNYWDFVYVSFCIGMTSQVSDVGVSTKQIRHTISMHAVISFFFNVALVALTVNIAASAL